MLEERYGRELDQWLTEGRLVGVCWKLREGFQVSSKHLYDFLQQIVKDAFKKETLWLELPGYALWRPTEIEQLLTYLSEDRGDEIKQMLADFLTRVIEDAPTERVERELAGIVTGQRPTHGQLERELSVSAMAGTSANPLPLSARALIELRYGAEQPSLLHIAIQEGVLDPVWLEMKKDLPAELQRLLPENAGN